MIGEQAIREALGSNEHVVWQENSPESIYNKCLDPRGRMRQIMFIAPIGQECTNLTNFKGYERCCFSNMGKEVLWTECLCASQNFRRWSPYPNLIGFGDGTWLGLNKVKRTVPQDGIKALLTGTGELSLLAMWKQVVICKPERESSPDTFL